MGNRKWFVLWPRIVFTITRCCSPNILALPSRWSNRTIHYKNNRFIKISSWILLSVTVLTQKLIDMKHKIHFWKWTKFVFELHLKWTEGSHGIGRDFQTNLNKTGSWTKVYGCIFWSFVISSLWFHMKWFHSYAIWLNPLWLKTFWRKKYCF